MLITTWLRTRRLPLRLPLRLVLPLDTTIRRLYHSTPCFQRAKPIRNEVQPLYVDTVPPTAEQLHASEVFFRTHASTKSWTATEWRQQPHSESTYLIPEVAFLGRSNSGKSSLLNGLLLDDQLCRVGAKPGKTITMHAWSLSLIDPKTKGARKGYKGDMEPKMTVLDMPGYGHGSHGDWGKDIMKYLTARRQLKRAFLLVNPVHGLKDQDLQMLELLRGHGIPHQLIACKADMMKSHEAPQMLNNMQTHIEKHFSRRRQIPLLMTIKDILTVGGLEKQKNPSKFLESAQGLHDVRWAILRATGLEEYAMILAANGGKMPKSKPPQGDQSPPDQPSSAPLQQVATLPMHADTHTTHVADEPAEQPATSPPPPPAHAQFTFTPQTTPSNNSDTDELVSEPDLHTKQPIAYKPNGTDGTADFSIDEFMADIMPARGQVVSRSEAREDRLGRGHGGRTDTRRPRMQDSRPPRAKDVQRYSGGRR